MLHYPNAKLVEYLGNSDRKDDSRPHITYTFGDNPRDFEKPERKKDE